MKGLKDASFWVTLLATLCALLGYVYSTFATTKYVDDKTQAVSDKLMPSINSIKEAVDRIDQRTWEEHQRHSDR